MRDIRTLAFIRDSRKDQNRREFSELGRDESV